MVQKAAKATFHLDAVGFQVAHQVVGGLVLESVRQGKKPQDWTLPELQKIAPELDESAMELLSARRALENHTPPGGTAPASVANALAEAERRLAAKQSAR